MFFAGKWMKLGEITLGELSQPQKKNTIFLSCVVLRPYRYTKSHTYMP